MKTCTTLASVFVSALVMSSGLAVAGPDGTASGSDLQTEGTQLSASAKVDRVFAVLELQEGDEALMRDAIGRPLVFREQEGERKFTRELIAHGAEGKGHRTRARLSGAVVKSSAFVDEHVIVVPEGVSEGEMAAMLMSTGDYVFVEPNWRLYPTVTPNDPQYGQSWQHSRLQSAAAWDLHTGTSDIIVAVCDSGVDVDHPDLAASYIDGYNAATNTAEVDGGDVSDVNGHGTFVSGLAAARGNNGRGVTGVGWNFSIMPVRVTNDPEGFANGFDLTEGARWAVDHGAHAINVSFSGGSSTGNQVAAKYIIDRGGLLFWSSGNDNNRITYDGEDIVLVGSTTSSDTRSGFSNYGPAVDLVAPGSSVRSTNRWGGYHNSSGTSYASPIAAGVGAMIYSVRGDELSARDVQDVLYRSVDDLGAPGRDEPYGRGRVNTFKAIQEAMSYEPRMALPFSESFDDASWTDVFTGSSGDVSTVSDTEGVGSVLEMTGDASVTTGKFAGRMVPRFAAVSYSHRGVGVEAGDSYSIEWLDEDGAWQEAHAFESAGGSDDGYTEVLIKLTRDMRWHGVQFRVSTDGSDSTDSWRFEDFSVSEFDEDPTPVAPFVDSFGSGLFHPGLWDVVSGAEIAVSASTHAASLGDGDIVTSFDIPMAQFGFTAGYVRFDAWTESGGIDDSVLVEARDVVGNWVELGTVEGNALSGSPETIQFETPLTTWTIDTFRIRLTGFGNDEILIDNVYVGPEALTEACSEADFAEPYGQLNFFDVSAYLNAFGEQDLSADMNNDGQFNFFDVSAFLNVFGNGCP